LVELLLKEVTGVPIPQRPEIKGNIVRRYMNISFLDLSGETLRFAVWQVDAEWDAEVEDVWRFSNNLRSILVKIGGYEPRKFEKYVLLFELVIAVVEAGKTLEINCGSTNLPLRELQIPDGKVGKSLKLIAGLPNRSKKIDEAAVSKRTGWKSFFGGDIESQLDLELIRSSKADDLRAMMAVLPPQVIVNRKAVHYLWTYREFLAGMAYDAGQLNRGLGEDLRVLTFCLTLDVPELFTRIWLWWKNKAEPKIKSLSRAKLVFRMLMQELYLVVHSKQFELLRRYPAKAVGHNKSLQATRAKLIGEVLENMEDWLYGRDSEVAYRRRKNYNLNYGPLLMHETVMPREHVAFMETLAKLAAK
jgi:hypothetical protein